LVSLLFALVSGDATVAGASREYEGWEAPSRRRPSTAAKQLRALIPPNLGTLGARHVLVHSGMRAVYAAAFAYAIFYNYNTTQSVILAISTSLLQQLAVLGAIFLFLRWRGNEVNRGR